jgi:hypothetical protein
MLCKLALLADSEEKAEEEEEAKNSLESNSETKHIEKA